jgi:glycosyltransferase involved in cell wall biosynthesis
MIDILLIRNAKRYDFGGGERFPVFLASVLKNNTLQPLVISRNPKLLAFAADSAVETKKGPWWSWQQWAGVYALLFPVYLVWELLLFGWYVGLFFRHRPAAIHVQSRDDFIAATFAARALGVKVIWTDHADLKHALQNITIWYKNPVGKLLYIAGLCADAITVVSKSEYAEISARLPKGSRLPKKMLVIHNGCFDRYDEFVTDDKSSEFTFCIAARLVKDKGVGEAIEAFRQFQAHNPTSRLVVVGDGPDAEEFKAVANDVPGIVFSGYQTNPYPLMAAADVILQPTYHEGFSVALVEACMLGRAIIATNVGGNPEIIVDHQTGLLVEPRDAKSLLGAMEELYADPELRNRVASNARGTYLEQFEFGAIVTEKFIPLYGKGLDV